MVVGVLRLDLVLHAPLSLKQKRGIVKQLVARVRNRFPVSCAETDAHDLWQRAVVAIAMVGQSEEQVRQVFEQIEAEIQHDGQAEVVERDCEVLHYA